MDTEEAARSQLEKERKLSLIASGQGADWVAFALPHKQMFLELGHKTS